jgi:thioredoxin 1
MKIGGRSRLEEKHRQDQSWPDHAVDLTEDEFNEFIFAHSPAVIVCWSDWCRHSRSLLPAVDSVSKEMAGKIAFGKVNAQQNPHFPVRFRVKATPTCLVFKDGNLVGSLIGDLSKEDLLKNLSVYID